MTQNQETAKAIRDIEAAVHKEQSAAELLATLSRLPEVVESTMAVSRIEAGRMNQLAEYLAEIRYLLNRFGSDPALQGVSRMALGMAGRYRDLEGRVKELRNDCSVNGS